MAYLPCKLFPSELETHFCNFCKEPCSALSFLIGSHFNHPRRNILENLDRYPIEIWSGEVSEFRSVSHQLVESATTEWDELKFDTNFAGDRIAQIGEEIKKLDLERAELIRQIQENFLKKDEVKNRVSSQFSDLSSIAVENLIPKMRTSLFEVFKANQKYQDKKKQRQQQKNQDPAAKIDIPINYKGTQMTLNVLADEMMECLTKTANELSTLLEMDFEVSLEKTTGNNHSNSNNTASASSPQPQPQSPITTGKDEPFEHDENHDSIDPALASLIRETLSSPRMDDEAKKNISVTNVSTSSSSASTVITSSSLSSSSSTDVPRSRSQQLKNRRNNASKRSPSPVLITESGTKHGTHITSQTQVKLTLEQLKELISQGFSSSSSTSSTNNTAITEPIMDETRPPASFKNQINNHNSKQSSSSASSNNNKSERRKDRAVTRETEMRSRVFKKEDTSRDRDHRHYYSSTAVPNRNHFSRYDDDGDHETHGTATSATTRGLNVLLSDMSTV